MLGSRAPVAVCFLCCVLVAGGQLSQGHHANTTSTARGTAGRPTSTAVVRNTTLLSTDRVSLHVYLLCPCLKTLCVVKGCPPEQISYLNTNVSACVSSGGNITCSARLEAGDNASCGGNITCSARLEAGDNASCGGNITCSARLEAGDNASCGGNITCNARLEGQVLIVAVNGGNITLHARLEGFVLLCYLPAGSHDTGTGMQVGSLYALLFPLSAALLALTLAVLALVPETRGAKSYIIVCHVVSLLAVYVFWAVYRLQEEVSPALCYAGAFLDQFLYLAAAFWINVLCYDIARTFRGLRPQRARGRACRGLLCYSLYAWGGPALVSMATAVMEFVEGVPASYIKPAIDTDTCEYTDPRADWLFIYGPALVLAAVNTALLGYGLVKIASAQRQTAILDSGDSGRHESAGASCCKGSNRRLLLYANLLLLLGPPRLALLVLWAVRGPSEALERLEDGADLLRALSIFLFVCCKPTVLSLALHRLRGLARC